MAARPSTRLRTRRSRSAPAATAANARAIPATGSEVLARMAKALGHPVRIRIVRLLLERRACIGCDIVGEIGLAQSTVSEHLRILKAAGIIMGEIERPRVCYSLDAASLVPLAALLAEISDAAAAGRIGGLDECPPGTTC